MTTHFIEEAFLGAVEGLIWQQQAQEGLGEGHTQSSRRPSISPRSHRQTAALMGEERAGQSAASPRRPTATHTHTHIHRCHR